MVSKREHQAAHRLSARIVTAQRKLLAVLVEAGWPAGKTCEMLGDLIASLCPCEREDVALCTCGRMGAPLKDHPYALTEEELADAF